MFADWCPKYVALGLIVAWASAAVAQDATQGVARPAPVHPVSAASAPAPRPQAAAPVAVPAAASAAQIVSPFAMTTADELTRLQDQTLVLQAKLKQLEAQQAVDARMQSMHGGGVPTVGNVSVVAIERIGVTRVATVRTSEGSEFEVAPGDTLTDGARVVSIDNGAVTVRQRSGRLSRLHVSGGPDQSESVPLPSSRGNNPMGGAAMMPSPGKLE